MPPMDMDEFKFPDEQEAKGNDADFEIEIEDDTPEEDRNKQPMPEKIVKELEQDELEDYSDEVKSKLKKLKKVYHDERRAKEAALREQTEAVEATRRLFEENKRMKQMLSNGEKEYVSAVKSAAEYQLQLAKKAYLDAHEIGDAEKMAEAQQSITKSTMDLERANSFKLPALQEEKFEVQQRQEPVQPVNRPDERAMAWQERNGWFGKNRSMTAYALGLHEELRDEGVAVGSKKYYSELDKTMRKRFPDYFDDEVPEEKEEAPQKKVPSVVAAATRSTSSKKLTLKKSQVALAQRLGITPEQYAKEFLKLES